jgi:hypothetical protein
MYIVEFRNKVLVLLQWAFQGLTFNPGARLITGSSSTDFDFNEEMAARRGDATADREEPVGTMV